MSQPAQPSGEAADCIEQAWEIVRLTEEIVGVDDLCPSDPGSDPHIADAALSSAHQALIRRLELTSVPSSSSDHPRLSALALRAEQTQVAVKDRLLALQCRQVETTQIAIDALRSATSTAALVERVPMVVYRMGFSRVLFSRVQQGMWLACSAFAGADEEMASKIVEAGRNHPRQLTNPLVESEMIRRGSPILVADPQTDPHVHSELVAVTQTAAYVAAPVFCWDKPIGLVHADRHAYASGVTEFDRDVLGMFAAALGLAFERNLMVGRLQAMRRAAEEHVRVASSLADELTLETIESAGPALPPVEAMIGAGSGAGDARLLSDLTTREAEVLHAIAAGKTNAQVASSLFVTEGTVKSHVKHILRKLSASNRTEAVAKYHRARQAGAPG